jgi:uncharacterized membrane protein YfcA
MADLAAPEFGALAALGLAVVLAGLLAGFVAGLLGVGGGIVLVPVLSEVWLVLGVADEHRLPLAVGSSLATIFPTAIRSVRGHDRKGAVDWDILRAWAPPTVLGAVCGVALAGYAGGLGLTLAFAAGASLLALTLLTTSDTTRLSDHVPQGPAAWAYATGNGALSALMGIGGGAFGATILALHGVAIHRAIGTAAGFGLMIAVPGTLGMIANGWSAQGLPPLSVGYVNLAAVILTIPAAMLSTPWGVAAAHALSRTVLRRVFAMFLMLTAARMVMKAF